MPVLRRAPQSTWARFREGFQNHRCFGMCDDRGSRGRLWAAAARPFGPRGKLTSSRPASLIWEGLPEAEWNCGIRRRPAVQLLAVARRICDGSGRRETRRPVRGDVEPREGADRGSSGRPTATRYASVLPLRASRIAPPFFPAASFHRLDVELVRGSQRFPFATMYAVDDHGKWWLVWGGPPRRGTGGRAVASARHPDPAAHRACARVRRSASHYGLPDRTSRVLVYLYGLSRLPSQRSTHARQHHHGPVDPRRTSRASPRRSSLPSAPAPTSSTSTSWTATSCRTSPSARP